MLTIQESSLKGFPEISIVEMFYSSSETVIRETATKDHLINIFHNNGAGMESIFNLFIVIFKNLLEDIHKAIMKE